ncbi:histidine kinase [Chenggangzhangella methanolivorans]|uniref:Histidine kinase n=1 Tax=Chenggangzhangella methanolivorans TaxID=1437009 RepID=A0A9E6R9C4_9HYPH|nr:histidine kinase [Chenggangzhangella methanolivorans]QZO00175.1 histidine kinase [Chenggangzhangella methanolivorans]
MSARTHSALTGLALLAALALPAPAFADDAADCDAGIAMISSEVAKEHPKATADALKTALRVAKREKGEKEYDECLDAVADAKKALGR